ncbi:MAG: outer membrane beta-barrel protein [Roseinatronobacter sp.]|nr:outer membrane beta-barrel protein [Roseinatronobacter sp.]
MKAPLISISILALFAGVASHAQTPPMDWKGPYVSLGASQTKVSYSASAGYSPAKASGAGASLIFGYNFRYDTLVYGPEFLANFSDIKGSSSSCGTVASCTSNIENYLAARIRVGYALDSALVFGTIGVAFDEQNQRVTGASDPSKRHRGVSLGLGAELPVAPNLSARAEIEYYRFDRKTYNLGFGPVEIRPKFTAARLGLSYNF